jgi:hypothetical protein
VVAPFFYQNLVGALAPQKQADGSLGWALPLDPGVRCIHMGDIRELGNIVAGAFAQPDRAGHGEWLPLVGDFISFNEIVDTLNRQGHTFSFTRVPAEVLLLSSLRPPRSQPCSSISRLIPTSVRIRPDRIALANKIAGRPPTEFSTWARLNVPVQAPKCESVRYLRQFR